ELIEPREGLREAEHRGERRPQVVTREHDEAGELGVFGSVAGHAGLALACNTGPPGLAVRGPACAVAGGRRRRPAGDYDPVGRVRERAVERLGEEGFDELDVERIRELVPLATHNQRGRGTLFVGSEASVNAEQLVRIVEGSMSSPVYELLKRPDELFVVEHAHLQPRFVEDSVRIALRDTLAAYPDLNDADFLLARQVNLETI